MPVAVFGLCPLPLLQQQCTTTTLSQVQIVKVGGSAEFGKKVVDIGAFEATDFPVAMQASTK